MGEWSDGAMSDAEAITIEVGAHVKVHLFLSTKVTNNILKNLTARLIFKQT